MHNLSKGELGGKIPKNVEANIINIYLFSNDTFLHRLHPFSGVEVCGATHASLCVPLVSITPANQ